MLRHISKSTYELLTPIISAISGVITITSVTENSTGNYTIEMCDTAWATVGYTVTIQGNSYKIITLVPNVSVTITGTVLPTTGTFTLYPPKFYHGTISVAEAGLNAKVNSNLLSKDKLPMIWLHEPVDEVVSLDLENPIYKTSDCDIYFLVDADFAKFSQNDHYEQAIKPMRQLIDKFLEAMYGSGLVSDNEIPDVTVTDLPRFGRYTGKTGAKEAIFSEYEMSGTKLRISIPFLRNQINCCT